MSNGSIPGRLLRTASRKSLRNKFRSTARPSCLLADDITDSPMRTSGGEHKQLQIFTVDAAAALK